MNPNSDEYSETTNESASSISVNDQGEAYDTDSGEVFEPPDSLGFLKLFEQNLWKLELIGNARVRLLCYLVRHMNRRNNVCRKTQAQIASDMDISRNYVSDMLAEMEQVGLLLTGRGYYQVNPDFVWLGDEVNRRRTWAVYYKKKTEKLNKPA